MLAAKMLPQELQLDDGRIVVLRQSQPADAAALLRYRESLREEPHRTLTSPGEDDMTVEVERQRLAAAADSPGMLALLAEADGSVVGEMFFRNGNRRRIAHRGAFYLSVAAGWRRRGVGTALLQTLIEWAEANPLIEKLNLAVLANNQVAIRLYRRWGFRTQGRRPKEIKFADGRYVDDLLLYRFV